MSALRSSRAFRRRTRRQLVGICGALEEQRDRAIGKQRADRDWLAGWLNRRADVFEAEARVLIEDQASAWRGHAERAKWVATELRGAARDLAADLEEQATAREARDKPVMPG